jgi:hypothetical protein
MREGGGREAGDCERERERGMAVIQFLFYSFSLCLAATRFCFLNRVSVCKECVRGLRVCLYGGREENWSRDSVCPERKERAQILRKRERTSLRFWGNMARGTTENRE